MYRSKRIPVRTFVVIFLLVIIGLTAYYFLTARNKLISPLPESPTFEVIFYTPTPPPVTISTPSATPKTTPKPAPTGKPKPTVTLAPSLSPTIKPT